MAIAGFLFAGLQPAIVMSNYIKKDAQLIDKLGISIDNVNQNSIRVYVSKAEFELLKKMGFDIVLIPDEAKIYADQLWETTKNTDDPMNEYYSIDEYNAFMQQTAQQYPEICQLINAGNSVQERPIWFLKISDNASIEENEPEVRLTSTIHGDEVVGYDLLIRLISLLTGSYGTDTRITNIVNNTEIWINPLTNPDGYVLHQRANANDVDLNRTFPDFSANEANDTTNRQPEHQALKAFADTHTSNISLNFHGGAQVLNYPWDCIYALHPDNDVFVDNALTYTAQNPMLYNSTEFEHGITNGAAWYVIHGSFQDWSNYYYTCMDITAEISNTKWPAANLLDGFWENNRESILRYIEKSQTGIHGIVLDTNNQPVSATIEIANRMVSYTDPQVGDFHRVLLPGTYQLQVNAYGYETQVLDNVLVTAESPTIVNVVMNALTSSEFKGYVRTADNQPISDALIKIYADGELTAQTDENGYFEIDNVFPGTYQVSISHADYMPFSGYVLVQVDANYHFVINAPLFSDSFDNGLSNWTVQAPWGITIENNNHVLTDSPAGNYANNITKIAKLNQSFDLNNCQSATVAYEVKYNLESNYDYVRFQISTDNSNWSDLKIHTGASVWKTEVINLSSFIGQTVYFRFKQTSDQGVDADGIYIDNFRFDNQNHYTVGNSEQTNSHPDKMIVSNYPNPFSINTGTRFFVKANDKSRLHFIDIFNIKGQKIESLKMDISRGNSISWISKNTSLASGIYFYRVRNEVQQSSMKKMLLIK